jgi:hypothetical protein
MAKPYGYCPKCGVPLVMADQPFCRSCGFAIPPAVPPALQAPPHLPVAPSPYQPPVFPAAAHQPRIPPTPPEPAPGSPWLASTPPAPAIPSRRSPILIGFGIVVVAAIIVGSLALGGLLPGTARSTATAFGSLSASLAPPTASPSSAPAYSPLSPPATFALTGSMSVARIAAAAALLHDGRVLVAGGYYWTHPTAAMSSSVPLASAELYDPNTGTFSATGSMTTAHGHKVSI